MKPPVTSHPAAKNIAAIVALEQQALLERSIFDRLGEGITSAAGSPSVIIGHATVFAVWIALNTLAGVRWDPYPFSLLTLALSLEAITLTGVVLMTQNRMTRQADKRAHLDLQINLLAEQELTAILRLLDAVCEKLDVDVSARDEQLQELLKETDVAQISTTLDRELIDRTTTE